MKTIIKLIVAALLCVADLNAGNMVTKPVVKDPYHLIVEGQFLAEKHIQYTVYKKDARGIFVSEFRDKAKKYFYVSCDKGSEYIVRFQDKHGNVKFLMIDATKEGYFQVDVDFAKPYDAKIYLTKVGYALTPLTNSAIRPDIVQK